MARPFFEDPDRFILAFAEYLQKYRQMSETESRKIAILSAFGVLGKPISYNNVGQEILPNGKRLESVERRIRGRQKNHKQYKRPQSRVSRKYQRMTWKPSVLKNIPEPKWIETMAALLNTLQSSNKTVTKAKAYRILVGHGFQLGNVQPEVIEAAKNLTESWYETPGLILTPYPHSKKVLERQREKFFRGLTQEKVQK